MKLYSFTSIKEGMNKIKNGKYTNLESYWIDLEAILEVTPIKDKDLQDKINEKNERIINLNTQISKIRSIISELQDPGS